MINLESTLDKVKGRKIEYFKVFYQIDFNDNSKDIYVSEKYLNKTETRKLIKAAQRDIKTHVLDSIRIFAGATAFHPRKRFTSINDWYVPETELFEISIKTHTRHL